MNNRTHKKRINLSLAIAIALAVLVVNVILIVVLNGRNADNQNPSMQPQTGSTATDQMESDDSTNDQAGSKDDNSADVNKGPTDTTNGTGKAEELIMPTQSGAECFQIDTPYCNLNYPADWKDFLQLNISEEDPYTVTFSTKLEKQGTLPLFSIIFGGDSKSAVGAIRTDDGQQVNINLQIHNITPDDSWSDSEINIAFSMQEAMNDVLANMPIEAIVPPTEPQVQPTEAVTKPTEGEQQPTEGETQPAEVDPTEGESRPTETEPQAPQQTIDQKDMAIDTPYGELHYPSKWSEYLEIKVDENNGYSVSFYCKLEGHDDQHLFTIHLGGNQGTPVASITAADGRTAEVRLTISEFAPTDAWTDEESNIFYAMQEDMNYLMQKLQ